MTSAADKKRWDDLHAALAQASEAELAYEIELGAKYGHNFQSQWLSKGQKAKLEKLRNAKDKIGEKIYELVGCISPRQWDRGVPARWVRSELTWEDAIRPKDEPLSVVVPGSYGSPDGYVKEQKVRTMPRTSKNIEDFKKFLDEAVTLVAGESSGTIESQAEEVHVAIVFNVTGHGRHPGAIYVDQNRFHASPDGALEEAYGLLEEWEREHYPMSEEDEEHRTETFDGRTWTLPANAFVDAVYGTDVEKFIDVEDESEGEDENDGEVSESAHVSEPNDARDILEGLGPYMTHEGHDAARESARIARMISGVRGNAERADKVLEEVDRLVAGNGIEPVRDENVNDNYYGDVVALYVNMGDTYETTLLYDTEEHEFHVTSWGDWYEAYEAEQEEEEPEEDEDPEDNDDDVFSREEMDEGYVISDKRGGGYSVSQLDESFDDMDEALEAIDKDMKKSNVYPNIYYVNDHGNIDLLDGNGNTIKSRV